MVITRIHILSMMMLAVMGVIILSLSLIAANRISITGVHSFSGSNRIYFSKEILPDHIAYPLLRVRDRIRLESASPEQALSLKLQFAEHRYAVAEKLLDKQQQDLAITTLSKSQKYMIGAGYQVLDDPQFGVERVAEVRSAVDHSLYRLELFSDQYSGSNSAVISQLRDESTILLQKLDERLEKITDKSI